MKYERITERRETPLTMSMWAGDSKSLKVYNRLAELENKIESGELVDRNYYLDHLMAAKDTSELTSKEIEFFAKHNSGVRKNAEAESARLTAENADRSATQRVAGGDMKYTEILKLKRMLEEANIPFTFTETYRRQYPAYQIRIGSLADVIECKGSYGNEQDLLEIMGGLTEEEMEYDSVLGYLTAEEVFKRFKYCWEHQTSAYEEEKDND